MELTKTELLEIDEFKEHMRKTNSNQVCFTNSWNILGEKFAFKTVEVTPLGAISARSN